MQVPQTENYTEFGKGTLIGSGADFAAGAAGSLLEQAISGERVNAGRGILGGLSNAVSGAILETFHLRMRVRPSERGPWPVRQLPDLDISPTWPEGSQRAAR